MMRWQQASSPSDNDQVVTTSTVPISSLIAPGHFAQSTIQQQVAALPPPAIVPPLIAAGVQTTQATTDTSGQGQASTSTSGSVQAAVATSGMPSQVAHTTSSYQSTAVVSVDTQNRPSTANIASGGGAVAMSVATGSTQCSAVHETEVIADRILTERRRSRVRIIDPVVVEDSPPSTPAAPDNSATTTSTTSAGGSAITPADGGTASGSAIAQPQDSTIAVSDLQQQEVPQDVSANLSSARPIVIMPTPQVSGQVNTSPDAMQQSTGQQGARGSLGVRSQPGGAAGLFDIHGAALTQG